MNSYRLNYYTIQVTLAIRVPDKSQTVNTFLAKNRSFLSLFAVFGSANSQNRGVASTILLISYVCKSPGG